ncbi:MAG: FAD-binding oxidoreductase [Fimbriimonadaceae bacterium]
MAKHVVIIGGGDTGLCSARYLLKAGLQVTIVDRFGCSHGASWGNAGMVVPSHFEPLANPAMLRLGMKMMLSPSGPLGFSGVGTELMDWMRRFISNATHANVEAASQLILDLNLLSKQLYNELLGDRLKQTGMLMVCKTEATLKGELALAKVAQKLGLNTEVLDRFDLSKLGFDAFGAVKFCDDASLTPPDFLTSLRNELITLGLTLVEAEATGLSSNALVTKEGEISGDAFVLAAGAWSGRFARELNLKLPLTAGRGYGFTVTDPPLTTESGAILVEARVATAPMTKGQRFTGVMELGAFGSEPNPAKLAKIRASIPDYLPAYKDHKFTEEVWVGHRPCTPDGLPYIGSFEQMPNLFVATGHGMMGMSLAPITGKLISEMINGETVSVDVSKCSPNRIR